MQFIAYSITLTTIGLLPVSCSFKINQHKPSIVWLFPLTIGKGLWPDAHPHLGKGCMGASKASVEDARRLLNEAHIFIFAKEGCSGTW